MKPTSFRSPKLRSSVFALHSTLRTPSAVALAKADPHSAFFANTNPSPELITFTNALSLGDDGWAQLAPFGDFPGRALLRQPDGSTKTFDAIQRLDRAAAEGMTSKFKSPWHRVKRFITGCHIYIGHPDVPAFANDYPDKTPKGMIVDLAVRNDGLYCKPVFTNEGSELIESKTCRALSGYWSAQQVGEENGKTIFRPDLLKSAGLTNHPNLPVHLMNETNLSRGSTRVPRVAVGVPPTASPSAEQPSLVNTDQINPILRKLLPWLAWHGVALAQEASADQVEAALAQLDTRLEQPASVANAQPGRAEASASPSPATDSPEAPPSPSSLGSTRVSRVPVGVPPTGSPAHDNPRHNTIPTHAADVPPSPLRGERAGVRGVSQSSSTTGRAIVFASPEGPSSDSPSSPIPHSALCVPHSFTNERTAHIATLLDLALATGRITAAQRPEWTARLSVEAAFANELDALQKITPALKTRALTLDMGARKIEIDNAADRH